MKRVAFLVVRPEETWLGGANYLRNLLWAVYETSGRDFDLVLLTGKRTLGETLEVLPPIQVIRTALMDQGSALCRLRMRIRRVTGYDLMLGFFLSRQGISILSHAGTLGRRCRVKTLGWIPDFQHRHLPRFFSRSELDRRDKEFETLLSDCTRVVVSSETARNDVLNFYPHWAHKVDVLRFAVMPYAMEKILARDILESRYGFKGNYLYVPNQFWAHKNHDVLVDALALLVADGAAPLCLLTGSPDDHRNPGHFAELMGRVQAKGLCDYFLVLGVVPYQDVMSLMANARLVLNPSLFEGWSTTVEEAKALGKALLLSDIPVHREQAPAGTLFFPPDDPHSLARQIRQALSETDNPDGFESRAKIAYLKFGETYSNIVSRMIA